MKSLPFTLFLLCVAAATSAEETVDWLDAARCVGRVCTVSGRVATQEDDEGVTRLYFDGERRDVSVLLVRSLFVTWPNYSGRDVIVTGRVRRFRDQVEIVVDRPRSIETTGETPSPVADPTPSAARVPDVDDVPPAADPMLESSEVERLRRQVQQLEQRLRELDGEGD